jgi:predicted naringenin-chalcone synthase
MSSLDILAHVAMECDDQLMKVSNDDFRAFVDDRLSTKLATESVELYHKLLQTPRTRAIAAGALDDLLDEDHRLRYRRYQEATHRLARRCVDELLARVPVDPTKIAAIVTNTTVGGTIPNLSSVVGNRLGSPSTVRVADLGYMGCAAALLALEHVETLLRPGEVGLVLSSEITSAMVNLLSDETTSAVANTVFGDGVGGFLVARRPHRHPAHLRVLGHAGSVLTDDEALAAITYRPNAVYHEIHLQPTISAVAGRGVEVVMRSLVRHQLATPAEKVRYALRKETPQWQRHVDYAVLHAAGKKVLDTLHHKLALTPRQSAHNLANFAANSNTSSASLYYGLAELTRTVSLTPGDTLLLLGYGSGFLTRGMVAEVRGAPSWM